MMRSKNMNNIECPECGDGILATTKADLVGTRRGEEFRVRMEALQCPMCGYKTVPANKVREFALRIADAYRESHKLLTSVEIRDLRRQVGMSQAEFAKFCHVGIASLKRWEIGEIQDPAMNRLMVLAVERKLEKDRKQFSPWGGVEPVPEHLGVQLELHSLYGLAGMPNGPPMFENRH